jgi:DNA-binding transcriptional ArsR family regulator
MILSGSSSLEGREHSATMATRSASRSASGLDVLAELLSSRVRAAVLGFLVAREDARFSLTELARHLALPISSVQHECYKLERLHVLRGRREGVSRRYWLDRDTPFVRELIDLVLAVAGREQLLAYAMLDFDGLHGALLTVDTTPSLVLVGELGLEELEAAQERTAAIFDVSVTAVDLAFFRPAEWQEHCANDHPVVEHLRNADVTVVAGDGAIWPA